jgi:hypothetical protein
LLLLATVSIAMQCNRHLLAVVCVAAALHVVAADPPAIIGGAMGNGGWLATAGNSLWSFVTAEEYQQFVACAALAMGLIALFDGPRFFKTVVVVLVMALSFCFAMIQLKSKWSGEEDELKRFIAALEVCLFSGFVAYRGWQGMQLLLGLVIGSYITMLLHVAFPHGMFQAHDAASHATWKIAVNTFAVLVGIWMVHENQGARKVFGVIAPLLGSSLVTAALFYFWLLSCSKPFAQGVCTHITHVPAVVEFWDMIARPTTSKAVGYFEAVHEEQKIDNNPVLEPDRILALGVCFVLFIAGMCFQLKSKREAEKEQPISVLNS